MNGRSGGNESDAQIAAIAQRPCSAWSPHESHVYWLGGNTEEAGRSYRCPGVFDSPGEGHKSQPPSASRAGSDSSAAKRQEPFIYGEDTRCPRCGETVAKTTEHVVRLTLVNGVHNASTDMQGTFHHRCAAELFEQFHGRTRGEPLRKVPA